MVSAVSSEICQRNSALNVRMHYFVIRAARIIRKTSTPDARASKAFTRIGLVRHAILGDQLSCEKRCPAPAWFTAECSASFDSAARTRDQGQVNHRVMSRSSGGTSDKILPRREMAISDFNSSNSITTVGRQRLDQARTTTDRWYQDASKWPATDDN
jgi:hypothetical protein